MVLQSPSSMNQPSNLSSVVKAASIAFLCAFAAFGIDARGEGTKPKNEPASVVELKIIDQFSDQLFDLIQRKDVKGYTALAGRPTDQFQNLQTGKPVDIPVQSTAEVPKALVDQFVKVVTQIEKDLDAPKAITLDEVEYWIRRDPNDKRLGLFVFDVTLTLKGSGKSLRVWQPGCAMSMRGVILGDGLTVTNRPKTGDGRGRP